MSLLRDSSNETSHSIASFVGKNYIIPVTKYFFLAPIRIRHSFKTIKISSLCCPIFYIMNTWTFSLLCRILVVIFISFGYDIICLLAMINVYYSQTLRGSIYVLYSLFSAQSDRHITEAYGHFSPLSSISVSYLQFDFLIYMVILVILMYREKFRVAMRMHDVYNEIHFSVTYKCNDN